MKNRISKLRNNKIARLLAPVLVVVLILVGFFYYQSKRDRIFIDNSLITADIITVSSPASGVLNEVDAQEGTMIKKGDPIAVVNGDAVRSRIDGLVISTNDAVGGNVTPQSTLAEFIDPSQMQVVGVIDENKGLEDVHAGQVASFTVDAYPGKTFWGFIDRISQTAKQTQAAFSISSERPTQQFQVYVRFNATDYPDLKNGMSAKLTIFTKTP